MAEEIFSAVATLNKELKIFETGGHGTDIFTKHPKFEDELAN